MLAAEPTISSSRLQRATSRNTLTSQHAWLCYLGDIGLAALSSWPPFPAGPVRDAVLPMRRLRDPGWVSEWPDGRGVLVVHAFTASGSGRVVTGR